MGESGGPSRNAVKRLVGTARVKGSKRKVASSRIRDKIAGFVLHGAEETVGWAAAIALFGRPMMGNGICTSQVVVL